MPRDIDIVVAQVRAIHPEATIEQLKVTHPADDDGLWFFGFHGLRDSIQVEASAGSAPFTIEHSDMKVSSDAIFAASVEQTVREVAKYLGTLKARAKDAAKHPTKPLSPNRGGRRNMRFKPMAASQILQDVYRAHIDHFGEPHDSWVFDDGKRSDVYPNRIDVFVWGATADCDITTFTTIGMSDRELPGAEHRAELHFAVRLTLPEKDRVSIARFLANLAMYPFQIGSFLDWWHTIADPGKIPLYSGAHCVLIHPRFVESGWDTIKTAEVEVHLLNVIPITREERALKEKTRIADALSSVDIFSPR